MIATMNTSTIKFDIHKMELLFHSPQIDVYYDSRHFFTSRWKGYFSVQQFKEIAETILPYLKAKNCGNAVIDLELMRGTFLQAVPWIEEYCLPQAVAGGLVKMGIVNSKDPNTQRSIERMLEVNDQYEAQLFEDYFTAEKWILGQLENVNFDDAKLNGRLVVRKKEKYVIIEPEDICYLHPQEKGTAIQMEGELHQSNVPLKDIFPQLPPTFIQIHRSYIININFVSSVERSESGAYFVTLNCFPGSKLPVSKKLFPAFRKVIGL